MNDLVKQLIGPAVLLIGLYWLDHHRPAPAPTPAPTPPPIDAHFEHVGREYITPLAVAYGQAWLDGAKVLDAGQPPATALETVGKSFAPHRLPAFQAIIKSELAKVVPDGKTEITADERAALGRAFRGLAQGLGATAASETAGETAGKTAGPTAQPADFRLADDSGQIWRHTDPTLVRRWVERRNRMLRGQ